jgi:hypothetical protein
MSARQATIFINLYPPNLLNPQGTIPASGIEGRPYAKGGRFQLLPTSCLASLPMRMKVGRVSEEIWEVPLRTRDVIEIKGERRWTRGSVLNSEL